MKVIFNTMQGGIGIFLEIDMEFSRTPLQPKKMEQISEDCYLSFEEGIPQFYKDGGSYIKDVVKKNYDAIKRKIGEAKILNVRTVNSNPAHYQVESFIGATILWLNENLDMNLDMPEFTFNVNDKKFDVRW